RERALDAVNSDTALRERRSSVVDEHVDLRKTDPQIGRETADLYLLREIGEQEYRHGPAVNLCDRVARGAAAGLIATDHHDSGTKLRHSARRFESNAAVCAGDDDDLPEHATGHRGFSFMSSKARHVRVSRNVTNMRFVTFRLLRACLCPEAGGGISGAAPERGGVGGKGGTPSPPTCGEHGTRGLYSNKTIGTPHGRFQRYPCYQC